MYCTASAPVYPTISYRYGHHPHLGNIYCQLATMPKIVCQGNVEAGPIMDSIDKTREPNKNTETQRIPYCITSDIELEQNMKMNKSQLGTILRIQSIGISDKINRKDTRTQLNSKSHANTTFSSKHKSYLKIIYHHVPSCTIMHHHIPTSMLNTDHDNKTLQRKSLL